MLAEQGNLFAYVKVFETLEGVCKFSIVDQAVPDNNLVEMEFKVVVNQKSLDDGVTKDMRSIKESVMEEVAT